jgi:hypothetical protein
MAHAQGACQRYPIFKLDPNQGLLTVAYGYRIGEKPLADLKAPKEGTKVTWVGQTETSRRVVACSLGPVVPSAALPHPDLTDPATTLAGVIKRAASKHPEIDQTILEGLRLFVRNFLEKNFTPLSSDSDCSVERWLAHANYPEWRKLELLDKHYAVINHFDKRYSRAKCFVKDECYPEYKHARGIYSRSDEFKTFVGPVFKLIEEVVYKHPAFVKHIPVADRPRYIQSILESDGELADATDYTAFESQFCAEIMNAVEMQLYEYMTQHLPNRDTFRRHLSSLIGVQRCGFRNIAMEVPTCRLSGEMCTSLGNGFSNLMFALYTAERKGCSHVRIVVEGDDGLMKYAGPRLKAEDFAPLGLTIKLDQHETIETASFCGIVYDSEELINIDDPREILANFGWGNAQYTRCKKSKKLRLLRCKALSLAHQYPGCPIISELAHYGLRVTRSHNVGNIAQRERNMWWRNVYLEALRDEKKIKKIAPGPRSRALVERTFGVSIEQQLRIEAYLSDKNDDGPLIHPDIEAIMSEIWNDYSLSYVKYVRPGHENIIQIDYTTVDHLSRLVDFTNEPCSTTKKVLSCGNSPDDRETRPNGSKICGYSCTVPTVSPGSQTSER